MFNLLTKLKRRSLARKGFSGTDKVRLKESQPTPKSGKYRPLVGVQVLVLIMIWLAASLTIYFRRPAPTHSFVLGQKVESDIYSEIGFEYEDAEKTAVRRSSAASLEPPVYRVEPAAGQEFVAALEQLRAFLNIDGDKSDAGNTSRPVPEPSAAKSALAGLTPERRAALEGFLAGSERWNLLRRLADEEMRNGIMTRPDVEYLASQTEAVRIIRPDGSNTTVAVENIATPESVAAKIAAALAGAFPENSGLVSAALAELLPGMLKANIYHNEIATQQAKAQAAANVEPVMSRVAANRVLLRQGTIISGNHLDMLEKYNHRLQEIRSRYVSPWEFISYSAICLAAVLGCAYFLRRIRQSLVSSPSVLLLTGTAVIIHFSAICLVAYQYPKTLPMTQMYFVLPFAFGAMLLAQLIGVRAAMVCGLLTALVSALQHGGQMHVFATAAAAATVGAILMRKARNRMHGIRAGIGVGVAAFAMQILFWLLDTRDTATISLLWQYAARPFVLAVISGLLTSVVVSTLLMPFFEYVFRVTTDVSLLELSDLNHPLLKRLQMEAPGTYHHSLMVAALAEQAAEAIGANPLLARVCAYFHDIGKLGHPYYFSENTAGDDPHQDLQPRMSSLVILNHVKEGIDLALQHKLNKPIREAIAQHHGTTLVYYFYRRAMELNSGKSDDARVREQEFRYPGPLPSRPEIALVSIADSCEAAVRAMEKPTPQKITDLVEEIVQKRIREGQFEDARLTFRELSVAKRAIAKGLVTMQHGRIKYPKENDDETDLFKAAAKAAAKKPAAPAPGVAGGAPDNASAKEQ